MREKIIASNQKNIIIPQSINKIINESFALEAEEAKKAGRLGFMARALVQATMPHSDPGDISSWQRINGNLALFMQSGLIQGEKIPKSIGLPYGSIPRLLLTWISSEVTKTKKRVLTLGNSLSEFLLKLELSRQGGARGDITRLKEQMQRLFSATISFHYDKPGYETYGGFKIADTVTLWPNPKKPEDVTWRSEIVLSERFYNEIINTAIPIDIGAIKLLKNSALALDIYCWLTYRMSYLRSSTTIPWEALRLQFGSDYADTKQGRYEFKRKFITQLKKVLIIYNCAKVEACVRGLTLKPSKTHIA